MLKCLEMIQLGGFKGGSCVEVVKSKMERLSSTRWNITRASHDAASMVAPQLFVVLNPPPQHSQDSRLYPESQIQNSFIHVPSAQNLKEKNKRTNKNLFELIKDQASVRHLSVKSLHIHLSDEWRQPAGQKKNKQTNTDPAQTWGNANFSSPLQRDRVGLALKHTWVKGKKDAFLPQDNKQHMTSHPDTINITTVYPPQFRRNG